MLDPRRYGAVVLRLRIREWPHTDRHVITVPGQATSILFYTSKARLPARRDAKVLPFAEVQDLLLRIQEDRGVGGLPKMGNGHVVGRGSPW